METISLKGFLNKHKLRLGVSVGSWSEGGVVTFSVSIDKLSYLNHTGGGWPQGIAVSLSEAVAILCRNLSGIPLVLRMPLSQKHPLDSDDIIGPYQIVNDDDTSICRVYVTNNRLVVQTP